MKTFNRHHKESLLSLPKLSHYPISYVELTLKGTRRGALKLGYHGAQRDTPPTTGAPPTLAGVAVGVLARRPAVKRKDLFVIHTKSDDVHTALFNALSESFERTGLHVWQYSDWRWTEPDRTEPDWRFDEDAVALMSSFERIIYGVTPRTVPGDVDYETLRTLIVRTPAVLALEVPREKVTEGMWDEVRILDVEFQRLFPFGRLALVSFGSEGFFTGRYPLRLGATLRLAVEPEAGEGASARLALFGLRVLARQDMFGRLLSERRPEPLLEALGLWTGKASQFLASGDSLSRLRPDPQAVLLIEELLSWARLAVCKFGAERVWRRLPRVGEWVTGCFDWYCGYADLSRRGLVDLVRLLASMGQPGVEALEMVRRCPFYREGDGSKVVSWEAMTEATRALAAEQRDAADLLLDGAGSHVDAGDELDDADGELSAFVIRGLGHLAEGGDAEERRRVAARLRRMVEAGHLGVEAEAASVSSFALVAGREDAEWLGSLARGAGAPEVRLQAVLGLMRVCGREALPAVTDFLRTADARARRFVASASWRIDDGRLYDLLLDADPRDEKLAGNVLYSLTRAGNGRALDEAVRALSSGSSYLLSIAAVSAAEIMNRQRPGAERVRRLVELLVPLAEEQSEVVRLAAVGALLRCSERRYAAQAGRMIEESFAAGKPLLVRALLVNGGLGLPDWPDERVLRVLLFHQDPDIRGAAAFVAGHQRRDLFAEELRLLLEDPSEVHPYANARATSDLGPTVAESAAQALGRIEGTMPAADTASW